ncbi:protein FAR1-RELATED SEQUENCE 5-like [Chenopodium quinoa]|uniref:protein FAR1-RELATED SEQUENCE 5-like n=1 Tax=Chenopodium quinoa TaxID=63459 RepID=UPI000B77AA2F|nr:protein FAR1-RELATED SEQUENCE 5-like [Chenopodium quinoa]
MWSSTGSPRITGESPSSSENEDYGGDGNDYSGIFVHDGLFEDAQQAIDWAKQVAIRSGFCLVVATHKSQRDGRMDRILRCDRYRKREERDFSKAIRLDSKRKGCGCQFRVKVRQHQRRDGWEVKGYGKWGYHNHELIAYKVGHRQLSGLSPAAKLVVKEMSDAQVKPAKILASVLEKFPEDQPNRRHIYNVRQKLRFERSEGRNPIQQLLHQAQARGYLYWFESDEDTSEVTHLFLVHPDCADMISSWPSVILIDSTYKTNKYKFPLVEMVGMAPTNQNFLIGYAVMKDETAASYRWVLEKLRNYIGPNVQPSAIVSDCEGGLFAPIAELFPESSHLLCIWHINNCVKVKAYNLFNKNLVTAETLVNGKWRKII